MTHRSKRVFATLAASALLIVPGIAAIPLVVAVWATCVAIAVR